MSGVTRRHVLKTVAGGSIIAASAPWMLKHARADNEIRLGGLCELSGPASTVGSQQALGIQMAVDEINKNGGIIGRQVKLIMEDTESKAAVGLTKAKRLVERDKVHALTGIIFSSISLGVQEYVNKEVKIPFINSGSSSPAISEPPACGRYSFACQPSSRQYVTAATYTQKKHGTKWFFIADDYAWGKQSVQLTKEALTRTGSLDVVGEEYSPFGTTNFAPYITKAIGAKPDVVCVIVFGAGYARVLKQLHQMGSKAHYHHYFWSQPDAAAAGDAVLGLTAGETYVVNNPKVPRALAFGKAFRAIHGTWPDPVAARGYTGVELLAQAIRKTGSSDAEAIVDALVKVEHDSVHGKLAFRECDHTATAEIFVVEGKYNEQEKAYYAAYVEHIANPDMLVVPCGQTGCEAAMKA